jgi:squalene-hopene/tetraprenyl-beta-curcumene cyclase
MKSPKAFLLWSGVVLGTVMATWSACRADVDQQQVDASIQKGVQFLKTTQADDGSWTSPSSLGITALVTHALLVSDVPVTDSAVQRGLKRVEQAIRPDGGIYTEKSTHKNYETAIAVLALQSANGDGRYEDAIQKGVKFLKHQQWDEEEVGDRSKVNYGGAGYGSKSRPDLSNTAFFLDALKAAGVSSSDPAVQKALVFVSRCQNLKSEHNQTEFAALVNDGGFYYTPAAGGSSMAGQTPDGGLRSYGSMTYAGLKSMIYAGLTPEDPRVHAAESWIRKFYTFDENPGMGQQGLYYYYQTMAKALEVTGTDKFTDEAGTAHDWRAELVSNILKRQSENGSWVNSTPRWLEGDPNLVTAYCLLALEHSRQAK